MRVPWVRPQENLIAMVYWKKTYLNWSLPWLCPPTRDQQSAITTVSCPYAARACMHESQNVCTCTSVLARDHSLGSVHHLTGNIIERCCLYCSPRKPIKRPWKCLLCCREDAEAVRGLVPVGQAFYLTAHMVFFFFYCDCWETLLKQS